MSEEKKPERPALPVSPTLQARVKILAREYGAAAGELDKLDGRREVLKQTLLKLEGAMRELTLLAKQFEAPVKPELALVEEVKPEEPKEAKA